jgi:hypothetical protein
LEYPRGTGDLEDPGVDGGTILKYIGLNRCKNGYKGDIFKHLDLQLFPQREEFS